MTAGGEAGPALIFTEGGEAGPAPIFTTRQSGKSGFLRKFQLMLLPPAGLVS